MRFSNALIIIIFKYPRVYSFQVLKAKKVKIVAVVTIGSERRQS